MFQLGRGCGQVVSALAFYSDDPSSNPAEAFSFSVKFELEKRVNNQQETGFSTTSVFIIRTFSLHSPEVTI